MEEEQPPNALAVSVRMPSFPTEEQQSRASTPGASTPGVDAALVAMGKVMFGSNVTGTSGIVMGNAFSRRNMSIIGTIFVKQFYVNVFLDNCYQENYIDCLRTLGSATSAKDLTTHLKTEERCIDGTCDWFIGLGQYWSWHSEKDRPLLLFLGKAGTGKTMMCHFLIDKLTDEENRRDRRRTVAYFFCDYHPQRSTATAVLAGLLVQLLQKFKDNFEHIRDDYLQYRKSLPEDFDNLWTIFYKFLKSLDGDIFLIIDGMDKCDELSRQKLLSLLMNSARIRNRSLTIKILLTSRSASDFSTVANRPILKANSSIVDVEQKNISEHLNASVSKFIGVRVENLPVFSHVKPKIRRIISKKAEGTYLWASFVLQDLDKALTDEEVDMKLENMPKDLYEVYDRMLRDIDLAKAEDAAFVLGMAALSRRPLRPNELGLFYTLRPGKRNSHELQALEQVKSYDNLHTACKSLVHLDSSGAMSFVHQSAKEYLVDRHLSTNYSSNNFFTRRSFSIFDNSRICNFIASVVAKMLGTLGLIRGISRYHVVSDKTHLLLLKICWTCINTRELQYGKGIIQRKEDGELLPNPGLHKVLKSRPELTYIVNEWQEHALAAGPALSTCRTWLSDYLDKLPDLRDVWLHRAVLAGDVNTARLLLDNHADVKTRWGEHGSILHGPSSMGNEEMVKLLLDHKADINAKGRLFDNALEAASSNSHVKMVQLLLEHGATVNAQDGDSCSALQIAAASGDTEIVRILLHYKANVNSSGGINSRPLLGATLIGHLELAQLLLHHGADVNVEGQGHAYALQGASCSGNLDVVKLLLKHGAKINATGGVHGSALDAAADGGHDDIKKWLTKCGAESNRKKDKDDNELYLAALMGKIEDVQILMKSYDINIQGGKHGSPLQAAAFNGHENVVHFLIDSKADVNAQGGKHGSPLQAAAHKGHEEIVRLLIKHGANVNVQGGVHGNALHAAAGKGHVEIVRVLLRCGVSANIPGEEYGTALNAAVVAESCDRKEIVQLLLENGALANVQNGYLGTPLLLAAWKGDIDIAELLIDNGAKVTAKGGKFGFALQAAAAAGKTDMAEFLLDRGADVNAKGGQLGFALQAAALSDEKDVVKLLLEHGAKVDAKGGYFGFALQAATLSDEKEIVKLLLKHGANVNAEGGYFGFALQAAAASGEKDTVELLLHRGANINANGGEFGSALQAAAEEGKKEIVEYLLDSGADINAKGGKYGFALQAAAYQGKKEVVKLLLNRRANVNAEGGEYGFALQAAAYQGEEEIVKLLLDRGALINAEGGPHGTALKAARCGNHENVVQVLLDWRGTRLDRKDSWALHRMGSWRTQVVRVGVDDGAADPTSPTFPSSGIVTSLATNLGSFWRRLNGFAL